MPESTHESQEDARKPQEGAPERGELILVELDQLTKNKLAYLQREGNLKKYASSAFWSATPETELFRYKIICEEDGKETKEIMQREPEFGDKPAYGEFFALPLAVVLYSFTNDATDGQSVVRCLKLASREFDTIPSEGYRRLDALGSSGEKE